MSKKLYLVRHAQASGLSSGEDDKHRTLTAEGRMHAMKMGRYLFELGVRPARVLSSTADRAVQTAELMAEQLKFDVSKIKWREEIYEASVRNLLDQLNQLDVEWHTAMIVGHNPAISYLAEYLTGEDIGDLSAGSVVHIDFEADSWMEVGQRSGSFIQNFSPNAI